MAPQDVNSLDEEGCPCQAQVCEHTRGSVLSFFLSFFLATPKEIVLAMWISLLHYREFTFYSDLQEPGNKNLFHGAG
jgi:hypothetical protein